MALERLLRAAGAAGVLALVWGCSGSDFIQDRCIRDIDCPSGRYCGRGGACVKDCVVTGDCGAGRQCTPRGRCLALPDLGVKPDGPPADAAPDGPPPDAAPPDAPPVDASPDMRPDAHIVYHEGGWWPDAPLRPDRGVLPDAPPSADLPPSPDRGPDAPAARCTAAAVGKRCKTARDCAAGTVCLLTSSTRLEGVCTCACTPDNLRTPLIDEDDCPGPHRCARLRSSTGATINYCVKRCTPRKGGNECAAGVACDPLSAGSLPGIISQPVCLNLGCRSDADCPVLTSKACTVGGTGCPKGQTCTPLPGSRTAGRCALPGACDVKSGLCLARTRAGTFKAAAKVGDPCTGDVDCGATMTCVLERPVAKPAPKSVGSCKTGADCCSGACSGGTCRPATCWDYSRNGMCVVRGCIAGGVVTDYACPAGSGCSLFYRGGVCLKTCDRGKASTCRGHGKDFHGDYECRDWSGLAYSDGGRTVPVAPGPLCEWGSSVPCSMFAGTTITCGNLAGRTPDPRNPMACRDIQNGKAFARGDDPLGFCLDTTASGAVKKP